MFKSKTTPTPEQALMKLKHYCGYQERCHAEVKERAYNLGLRKAVVEQLISQLIEDNYLNEERFATLFVGGYFRQKKWGINKIIYALRQKKISEYNIKKGLKEIDQDAYQQTAAKLVKAKWLLLKHEQYINRETKTMAYMIQKGYEPALIQGIIKNLRAESAKSK